MDQNCYKETFCLLEGLFAMVLLLKSICGV